MEYRYEFARPGLTVDVAVVRGSAGDAEILLVRRAFGPHRGAWALPGGFVDEDEPLEDAARRELVEETALAEIGPLVQVGAYGDPGRDPRGWTVSVLFLARLGAGEGSVQAGDDASEAEWFAAGELPELAFDHALLCADALGLAGVSR